MIGVLPQTRSATPVAKQEPLVQVENLRTELRTEAGRYGMLEDVSFSILPGRTLALVGETGSGKSMAALSLMRLLPAPAEITGGRMVVRSSKLGVLDLAAMRPGDERLYRLRGGVIGYISQEPLSALSPVHSIGDQIYESVRMHTALSRRAAKVRVLDMLDRVGISNPARAYDLFPHQLSGGLRQRVVIAMALVCQPELVIADEPTTALDVSTQAQVLGLLKSLQQDLGCAVLLITHDMGLVAQMADEVAVMYFGQVVEQGDVRRVLKTPLHPYTRGLLQSLPATNSGGRFYAIPGSAPSALQPPAGCPFAPRCASARDGICNQGVRPKRREWLPGHASACLRTGELQG